MQTKAIQQQVSFRRMQSSLAVCGRLVLAALAGWAVLVTTELVSIFGALPVFAFVMDAGLLPSLKVVLDMGSLAACGWIAGRVGRPRVWAAALLTAAGLAAFDLTPYLPLNVAWVLRLAKNALGDSRFVASLSATLTIHALMFGSLFAGAQLSRPRRASMELGIGR